MSLEHYIREAAAKSLQATVFPCPSGYTANVKQIGGLAWTQVTRDDPVDALREALRQRNGAFLVDNGRSVSEEAAHQIDIEDVIAGMPVDEFDGLLG